MYRRKVFIIALLVFVKYYLKALIVVYIFRMKPVININQNELITSFPNEEQGSFIDDINAKKEKSEFLSSDIDSASKIQPNLT